MVARCDHSNKRDYVSRRVNAPLDHDRDVVGTKLAWRLLRKVLFYFPYFIIMFLPILRSSGSIDNLEAVSTLPLCQRFSTREYI